MSTIASSDAAFIPADLDASDFRHLSPFYAALEARPLDTRGDVERWLLDLSDLTATVEEYGSRRYIDKSCHTDDAEIEQRYMHFVEHVEPSVKPALIALQEKLLSLPGEMLPDDPRHRVLIRRWRADAELFREANVPLETEATKLVADYDKISGAMTVRFEGAERTMQQMSRFAEQTDRALRQSAWEASSERRMRDRAEIETNFESLLDLRTQMAANAGLGSYPRFCMVGVQAIRLHAGPVHRLRRRHRADVRAPGSEARCAAKAGHVAEHVASVGRQRRPAGPAAAGAVSGRGHRRFLSVGRGRSSNGSPRS